MSGAVGLQDEALLDFPRLDRAYESAELFPLFKNRVLSARRRDFAEYLRMLDLSGRPDPVEILSVAGGQRATDSLEVFPKVIRRDDGSFQCRFFVHGCRYVSAAARERVETLSAGEELVVALELNNPASGLAAQLQSICVRELRITGLRTPRYNRRADLVCFVNGLPLVLFELKAVHVNIRAGFAVRGCIEG